MAASRILLVDADEGAAGVIADTLKAAGHTVTVVAGGSEVFQRASEAGLVVLDVPAGATSAVDLCRELRATPALAAIPVLCIAQSDDVEARIAFLEVGADDVVAKPFDARELEARVEALILRFQRSRELAPASTVGGEKDAARRIVAVFSPKGGAGTTTIAANLAVVLARRKPDSVVLVDLDLQFGQVATQLDLEPIQTLADVFRDEPVTSDPELLRTYAAHHDLGLYVLASPGHPALAGRVRPEDATRLLESLLGTFEHVVVDAGSTLDAVTLAVFERADEVVIPVLPEVPALKALHRLLEHVGTTGTVGAKTMYVLNSMYAKELLRTRDVETALGAKVAASVPYDPFLYLKAVNEGVPVVAGAPRTAAAESLVALAGLIFPSAPAPVEMQPEERRRGLLGLRRRG